ncbi:MAG: VCBS repeat-containing protein [Acidobacteria bacterium]|nr:VCBS repeat-containing protein [Acidobacteriota bacterium]
MRIITNKGMEGGAAPHFSEIKAIGLDHNYCCFRAVLRVLTKFKSLLLIVAFLISLGVTALAESVQIWEVPVGYFFVNTPATGDLNGDGQLDIVVTASGATMQPFAMATTGLVTAVTNDGTPLPGWPVTTDEQIGFLPPTPATVADLDGDGRAEVILGHGHSLYVFGGDGRLLWRQRVDGFFKKKPEVCDLNGDGQLEIINAADQFLGQANVHIWRADGQAYPGSPLVLDEFFASSPAVYQDASRTLLAVGGGNGYSVTGGSVYLFASERGRLQFRWQLEIGQHAISKPVFADVDGDGIVDVLGGTYTPSVYAVRTTDGRFLPGWPRPVHGSVYTSPAVLQANGQTMILAVALTGTLYAWDSRGQSLWTVTVNPNAIDQMTLADINSDNTPEIVLGVNGGVLVVDLYGTIRDYWSLGDYWVTGTLTVQLQPDGLSSLVLGGVDNITEEAKLFILRH